MAPFLERVKSFANVPITDAGVETLAFLEAAEGVVQLFSDKDLLGKPAFSPVKNDMEGNIAKVRARYDATPTKSATLEQLVINEKPEKKHTATEGLMWLLRGLYFTCKSLQNSQANTDDKNDDLSAAFSSGYKESLKQFHNWLVKGVFEVAMAACPYRSVFYSKLAADPSGGPAVPADKLNEELDKWLAGLDAIVKRMAVFYEEGGYGKIF